MIENENTSSNPPPAAGNQSGVSRIQHPTSGRRSLKSEERTKIQHPEAIHRTPNTKHQTPKTEHQTPNTENRFSGLYIHVPFCVHKCRYCDFASCTDLPLQEDYTEAVCREMTMAEEPFAAFETLYMGGGTPTAVKEELLLRILDRAFAIFSFTDSPEVTVEANPGTVSAGLLKRLRRAGVNRINIGAQSFSDQNLRFLGRIHSAKEAENCIGLARDAGFDSVGFDLIYGLPGQGRTEWLPDLEKAVSLIPDHLSCYMLTFEPGAPLSRDLAAGRIAHPCEKTVAALFTATSEMLQASGYLHYEVSNFARAYRFRSRHNLKYWTLAPILGLGPSAHSFFPDPPSRWWNLKNASDYLKAVREEKRRPVQERETLTPEQRMTEAIFLSLRTADGIAPADFERRFGRSFEALFGDVVRELEAEEMLKRIGRAWAPTLKGMLFADTVVQRFIERI